MEPLAERPGSCWTGRCSPSRCPGYPPCQKCCRPKLRAPRAVSAPRRYRFPPRVTGGGPTRVPRARDRHAAGHCDPTPERRQQQSILSGQQSAASPQNVRRRPSQPLMRSLVFQRFDGYQSLPTTRRSLWINAPRPDGQLAGLPGRDGVELDRQGRACAIECGALVHVVAENHRDWAEAEDPPLLGARRRAVRLTTVSHPLSQIVRHMAPHGSINATGRADQPASSCPSWT